MKLSELIGQDGAFDARFRRARNHRHCVRQPQGEARRPVRRGAGQQGGRLAVRRRRRSRRARPRSWQSARRRACPTMLRSCAPRTCAARSRWPRRGFYPRQPKTIAAVTGTSGKTSVAAFTRQIWAALGNEAASIGTIGLVTPKERGLRLAHHARPDRACSARSIASPRTASRISRWKPPRTASTSIASTACA